MVGNGWPWLVMVGDGWLWLATVGDGHPTTTYVFVTTNILFRISTCFNPKLYSGTQSGDDVSHYVARC